MKVRILAGLVVLLALTGLQSVNAYDLSDYPAPFVENGDLNVRIVVGGGCCTSYVVEAANLIAQLKSESSNTIEATSNIDSDSFSKTGTPIIAIGGPHENRFTAEVMGLTYPTSPTEAGIPEDYAIIEQITHEGNPILIVAGSTEDATLAAINILKDYNRYSLEGTTQLASEAKDLEEKSEECTPGCGDWSGCMNNRQTRTCYNLLCEQEIEEQDCQGCEKGWLRKPFCKGGDVYDTYLDDNCNEEEKRKVDCSASENCMEGKCVAKPQEETEPEDTTEVEPLAAKSETSVGIFQIILDLIKDLFNF